MVSNLNSLKDEESSIIQLYADAQGAVERLEERLLLSPVRQPWRARMALVERQTLASIDDNEVPEHAIKVDDRGRVTTTAYDLTHWKQAIGAPITLHGLMSEPLALLQWFGVDPTADQYSGTAQMLWDIMPLVERWSEASNALPPSPPLLHSGRIAALWRQFLPLGRGDIIASLLIGDRWGPGRWKGSQGGLIAVGLKESRSNWKLLSGEQLDRAWLIAIRDGARAHLATEVRLRAFAARARAIIARRQRPGHLKSLLLYAMARPFVTSGQIAQAFGLTSAGAIKLLTTAANEGLLIERTGQSSYRSYMVPVSSALPSPPNASSPHDPFERSFWEEAE